MALLLNFFSLAPAFFVDANSLNRGGALRMLVVLVAKHDGERGGFTEFRAGQGGVIPGGFVGAFEVVEPVRKHFVVVERSAG